ncbi:MAG: hypothetical protein ACP5E2_03735 [Terracidiphilus sp.]
MKFSMVVAVLGVGSAAFAAQLSTDARGAIPHDVQQLVVIDYHAMQNSPTAMNLRDRVMPPELKRFDEALSHSGLNENHDVDELAFALFRPTQGSESLETVGIAQGQFDTQTILGNFRRQKVKATQVRNNSIYPMARTGMVLCFVDPSTMIFGDKTAVTKALDARDGMAASVLSNSNLMNAMQSVDSAPLWSILDNKGTQTMMKQLLGQAGSVTDYDTIRKRLEAAWYSMDFQHGVRFDLTIATGDTFAAATISSLMSAAVMVRKMSATDAEKQALTDTDIASSAGNLTIHYASSDTNFNGLLHSPLFSGVVQ